MATTWRTRTLTTFSAGHRDYGTEGLFGILNNSPDTIELRSITIQPASGSTMGLMSAYSSVAMGRYIIQRISACSGGTDIPVAKHDTNSNSLPSQVLIKRHPDSVTLGDVLRYLVDSPGLPPLAAPPVSGGIYGAVRPGADLNMASAWNHGGSATAQRFILAEGEGIAIVEDVYQTYAHVQSGEMQIRNATDGSTYMAYCTDMSTREAGGGKAVFALFNGAGSGVTLDVTGIAMADIGRSELDGSLSNYRLAFIEDMTDGETLPAVAMDTASDPLPATVLLRKNFTYKYPKGKGNRCSALSLGNIQPGAVVSSAAVAGLILSTMVRQGTIRPFRCSPFDNFMPVMVGMNVGRTVINFPSRQRGIVLRTGEGLAIAYGWPTTTASAGVDVNQFTQHTANNLDIGVEFTYTPGGGGGNAGRNLQLMTGGNL